MVESLATMEEVDVHPEEIWRFYEGTSQEDVLSCPHWELLYTGTRGPGKTDTLCMDFASEVGKGWGPDWRGVLFRHEYKPLGEIVKKTEKFFYRMFEGARFLRSQSEYKWVFKDGEELLLRAFKSPSDYWDYHGHEYPWIGWEEITAWPSLDSYHLMKSCNRSSRKGIPLRYRSTCNPYGPGHNQVKAYFIDPAPESTPFIAERTDVDLLLAEYGVEVDAAPRYTITIHGHYSENRALMEAQPDYPAFIAAAAENPEMAKAWLTDNWDIVSGGMFDDLWTRERHILPQFQVPDLWTIFRAFDWGATKPFSVGWWARANGESTLLPDGRVFCPPRSSLIRVGEWYGWDGKTPNRGIKMADKDIGKGIVLREKEMGIAGRVLPGPADSSIFTADPGKVAPSEDLAAMGAKFIPAEKGPGSRIRGWSVMRGMLEESAKDRPEEPGMWVMENCRQFIRTIPTIPRDDKNLDDVDTDAEDHIADETRYAMGMPEVAPAEAFRWRV
jgi:hypothetical protein